MVRTDPGPAIVMCPMTNLFGSVASSNTLKLLSFSLAGWGAYLACHRLTKAFCPSLLGGYLFGFSTYMVRQGGHLTLSSLSRPAPALPRHPARPGIDGNLDVHRAHGAPPLGLFSLSTSSRHDRAVRGRSCISRADLRGEAPCSRPQPRRRPGSPTSSWAMPSSCRTSCRRSGARPMRPAPLARASADLFGFVVPRPDIRIRSDHWRISNRFSATCTRT